LASVRRAVIVRSRSRRSSASRVAASYCATARSNCKLRAMRVSERNPSTASSQVMNTCFHRASTAGSVIVTDTQCNQWARLARSASAGFLSSPHASYYRAMAEQRYSEDGASAAPPQPVSQLVAVGASAGGVEALTTLVSTLPENFAAPVVIA